MLIIRSPRQNLTTPKEAIELLACRATHMGDHLPMHGQDHPVPWAMHFKFLAVGNSPLPAHPVRPSETHFLFISDIPTTAELRASRLCLGPAWYHRYISSDMSDFVGTQIYTSKHTLSLRRSIRRLKAARRSMTKMMTW
jgi:hypothetical protein